MYPDTVGRVHQYRQQGHTAADILAGCLQRIAQHNPRINAVVTLNPEAANQAAAIAAASAHLSGVPITIKDAFATAGLRTTAGYPPLRDYLPGEDAAAVAKLKAAGAIVVGKTNLPLLAGDIQCHNPIFGRSNNPFDIQRTTGGSSGGGAAAVAMGFSVLDLGSDLAGSIRIPASFCGVAGLKATENRINSQGHIPPLPQQARSVWHMLSLGFLARDVASLHSGLAAVCDDYAAPTPVNRPLRVAYWADFGGIPLCPRTRLAWARSLACLQQHGIDVQEAKPAGFDFQAAWTAYGWLAGSEIGLGLPAWQRTALQIIGQCQRPTQRLLRAFGQGMALDMRRYNQALNTRTRLAAALDDFLQQWDVWLCPVSASAAFQHIRHRNPLRHTPIREDGLSWPYLDGSIGHTVPFSLTGHPVVCLPAGLSQGLPVGLQLIGGYGKDEALLLAAAHLESIIQGFQAPV